MTFTKSILLGSSAVLMGAAAAQAADLPSRKSAPVEYVRVCDAYGAGFFFIPGTQTCLRIGGRVRADYAFVPGKDIYTGKTTANVPVVGTDTDGQHTVGWEARGRISFDARTQTSWGTLQAVALLRMNRTSGVLQSATGASANSTGSTLEAAYVRFAGFTFGAASDNFVYMPSMLYGSGHWGSFANGAKQISYTATFGGGLAATIALQDYQDTTGGAANATGIAAATAPYYVQNSIPQIVGRLQWTQGWGNIAVMGAVARPNFANNVVDSALTAGAVRDLATFDKNTTVWALGTGVTINLPMLARGSALYLTANYANGMTEYTTRFTSFSSSAFARDVGGFQMNHPSVVLSQNATGVDRIDTVKSWNVAAMLQHFWAPQYRSIFFASYGSLSAPAVSKAVAWNGTTGFGDAKVWNVGTQFAWLPTSGFEIGVEVIYSRVSQDVAYVGPVVAPALVGALLKSKESDGNFTGRLRVERNF